MLIRRASKKVVSKMKWAKVVKIFKIIQTFVKMSSKQGHNYNNDTLSHSVTLCHYLL